MPLRPLASDTLYSVASSHIDLPETYIICIYCISILDALYMNHHFVHSSYGMLASMSNVLGTNMVPHLEVIINKMLESLRSSEGVKVPLLTLVNL